MFTVSLDRNRDDDFDTVRSSYTAAASNNGYTTTRNTRAMVERSAVSAVRSAQITANPKRVKYRARSEIVGVGGRRYARTRVGNSRPSDRAKSRFSLYFLISAVIPLCMPLDWPRRRRQAVTSRNRSFEPQVVTTSPSTPPSHPAWSPLPRSSAARSPPDRPPTAVPIRPGSRTSRAG